MRKELAGLMVGLSLVGCSESSVPGGPGVTHPANSPQTANRPTYSESARTFELSVPILSTHLKQGETKTATISLSRGKDFNEDVTLTLNDLPEGVTVEPAAPKIMHDDKEVKLNLTAAHDAAVGDFTINIVGHPTTGPDATNKMKITIAKE